ncbi:MAG: phosphate acyltransferase PlsX [Paraglaciecola sp.]|nr:phosphate acyltransferase PlsX [Paraglaciecola sp.]
MRHLTLALDIMGGDFGPHIILAAAKSALSAIPHLNLILCGDEHAIRPWLSNLPTDLQTRTRIEHSTQTVLMGEAVSSALRSKKDSSMRRMLDCVEQGRADGCVSAGNTGALMAMAYLVLKTLPGIERPALISQMPATEGGKVYLLDLGANVDCSSDVLWQYAVMGSIVAELVGGITQPKVALLNVGTEENKGNDRIKATSALLNATPSLHYIGYVEGNDIFSQRADVIVTDGFAGNVALKSCEGLAKFVLSEVKKASNQNWLNKILAKIALPLLRNIYLRMNPDQYNGASLIGLRGIVVKSHGNASSEAFLYAIREAVKEVEMQVPNRIKDKIEAVLMERHD